MSVFVVPTSVIVSRSSRLRNTSCPSMTSRSSASRLFAGDPVGQPDHFGLREPTRFAVLVEPVNAGQHRDRFAGLVDVRVSLCGIGVDRRGEFADGGAVQHQPRPQRDAATAHGLHDGQGHDAVQAESEEAGRDVDSAVPKTSVNTSASAISVGVSGGLTGTSATSIAANAFSSILPCGVSGNSSRTRM